MNSTSKGRFNLSEASLQTSVFRVNPIRSYHFDPAGTNSNKRRKALRNSPGPRPTIPPSSDLNLPRTLPFRVSPDTSRLAAPVGGYGYNAYPPENSSNRFPTCISAPVTPVQSYYPSEAFQNYSTASPQMSPTVPSSVPLSTFQPHPAPAVQDLYYNSAPLPSITSTYPRQENAFSTMSQRTLVAMLASSVDTANPSHPSSVAPQGFSTSHAFNAPSITLSATEPLVQLAPITDDVLMALTEPFLMSWCMRIQPQQDDSPPFSSVSWNDTAQPQRPWTGYYGSHDPSAIDYISNHSANSSSEYGMYTS